MASPESMAYHEQKRLGAVRNSQDRVKAIDGTSNRMSTQSATAYVPYTSTGSRNSLSFVNPDQSDKILESPITGGVQNINRKSVQQMLSRRAEDVLNMKLAQENLPPMEAPLESLSEEESLKLELSTALSQAQAFGSTSQSSLDLKNYSDNLTKASRLIIRLAPILTEEEVDSLVEIYANLLSELRIEDESADKERTVLYYGYLREIAENTYELLKDLLEGINLSAKDKTALIKPYIKALKKPFSASARIRASPVYADFTEAEEEAPLLPVQLRPETTMVGSTEVPREAILPGPMPTDTAELGRRIRASWDAIEPEDREVIWRQGLGRYKRSLRQKEWEKEFTLPASTRRAGELLIQLGYEF